MLNKKGSEQFGFLFFNCEGSTVRHRQKAVPSIASGMPAAYEAVLTGKSTQPISG
jgi:hypothetical protein